MPALDRFHDAVRNALIKDGWTITADPLTLRASGETVFVDLAAEKVIAAEKDARKIAVEVKTFLGPSKIAELENAIGQYMLYRKILSRLEPDRELYLAAPQWIVESNFQQREIWRAFVIEDSVRIIGFDPDLEEILSWTP